MIKKLLLFCTIPLLSMATENAQVINISTNDLRIAADLARSIEKIIADLPPQATVIRGAQNIAVVGAAASLAYFSAKLGYNALTDANLSDRERGVRAGLSVGGFTLGLVLIAKAPELLARFGS